MGGGNKPCKGPELLAARRSGVPPQRAGVHDTTGLASAASWGTRHAKYRTTFGPRTSESSGLTSLEMLTSRSMRAGAGPGGAAVHAEESPGEGPDEACAHGHTCVHHLCSTCEHAYMYPCDLPPQGGYLSGSAPAAGLESPSFGSGQLGAASENRARSASASRVHQSAALGSPASDASRAAVSRCSAARAA